MTDTPTPSREALELVLQIKGKYRADEIADRLDAIRIDRHAQRIATQAVQQECERAQRVEPSSAPDAEAIADRVIRNARTPKEVTGRCYRCGASVNPVVPGTKCQSCRCVLPYPDNLQSEIAVAVAAARAQAAKQMREAFIEILEEEGWLGNTIQRLRALPLPK